MPWLASRKRKLAVVTSSAALKADAAESALCGYMHGLLWLGLMINAIQAMADPVAAVLSLPSFCERDG